jgi:hypothetical protein
VGHQLCWIELNEFEGELGVVVNAASIAGLDGPKACLLTRRRRLR